MTSLPAGGVCVLITCFLANLQSSSAFPVQTPFVEDEPIRLAEEVYVTEINNISVCVVDGDRYTDGQSIPTVDPCESCICHPPGFVCTQSTCSSTPPPGCHLLPAKTHQCCPDYVCNEPQHQKNLSYRVHSSEDSSSDIPVDNTDVTIVDESATEGNSGIGKGNIKNNDYRGSTETASIMNDAPSTKDPNDNLQTESPVKNVYTAGFVKSGSVTNNTLSDRTKSATTESETEKTLLVSEKDRVNDLTSSESTLSSITISETKSENPDIMIGDQPKVNDGKTNEQKSTEANEKPTVSEELPSSSTPSTESESSSSSTGKTSAEDTKDSEVTSTVQSVIIQENPTSSQMPKHGDPKSKSYDAVTEINKEQEDLTDSEVTLQPVNELKDESTVKSSSTTSEEQQETTTPTNSQSVVSTEFLPMTNNLNKEQTDNIEERNYVSKDNLITSPPLQKSTQTVNYTLKLIPADLSTTSAPRVAENSEIATKVNSDFPVVSLHNEDLHSTTSSFTVSSTETLNNDEKSQTKVDESNINTSSESTSDGTTIQELNSTLMLSTPGSLRSVDEPTEDKLNIKAIDNPIISTSGPSLPQIENNENNENNINETSSDDVVSQENTAAAEVEANAKSEKTTIGEVDISTESKSDEDIVSISSVESIKESDVETSSPNQLNKEKPTTESATSDQPSENNTLNSVPKPGTILIDTSIEISPEHPQSCNCTDLSFIQPISPNIVEDKSNVLEESSQKSTSSNLADIGNPIKDFSTTVHEEIATSPVNESEQKIEEPSGPIVFPNHTRSTSKEHELRPRDAQRKNVTTVNNSTPISTPDSETSTKANGGEEESSRTDQPQFPKLQYRIVPAELEPEVVTNEAQNSLQQSNKDAVDGKFSNKNDSNNTEPSAENVDKEEINTELSFLSSPLDDVNAIQEETLLTEEDSRRPEGRKDDSLADTKGNNEDQNINITNIQVETSATTEDVTNSKHSEYIDDENKHNSNFENEEVKEAPLVTQKVQNIISTTSVPSRDDPSEPIDGIQTESEIMTDSEVPNQSSAIKIDNRKVEIVPEYHVTSELSTETNLLTSTRKDTYSSGGFILPQVVAEKEAAESGIKSSEESRTKSSPQNANPVTSNSHEIKDDHIVTEKNEANDKENTKEQFNDSISSDEIMANTDANITPLDEPTLTPNSDNDDVLTDTAKDQAATEKNVNNQSTESNQSDQKTEVISESNKSTEPSVEDNNKNPKKELDYPLMADEPMKDDTETKAYEKAKTEEEKFTSDSSDEIIQTETAPSQTTDKKLEKEEDVDEKVKAESLSEFAEKKEFTLSTPASNKNSDVTFSSEFVTSSDKTTEEEHLPNNHVNISNTEQEDLFNAEATTGRDVSDFTSSTSQASIESIKRAKIDIEDLNTDSPPKDLNISDPQITTYTNKMIQEEKEVGIFHIVNKLLIETTTTQDPSESSETKQAVSSETSTPPSSLFSISDGVSLDGFLSGRISSAEANNTKDETQAENNVEPIAAVVAQSMNSETPIVNHSTESTLTTRNNNDDVASSSSPPTKTPVAESTTDPKLSASSFTVIENSSENYISPSAKKEVEQEVLASNSPENDKSTEIVQSGGTQNDNEISTPVISENAFQSTTDITIAVKEQDEGSEKLNENYSFVSSSYSSENPFEDNTNKPIESESENNNNVGSNSPSDFESLTSSTQRDLSLDNGQSQVTITSSSEESTSTNQHQSTEQPSAESTTQVEPNKQARLEDNVGNPLTSTKNDFSSNSTESVTTVNSIKAENENQEPASSEKQLLEVTTETAFNTNNQASEQNNNDKDVSPLEIQNSEISSTIKDDLQTPDSSLSISTIVPRELPTSTSLNDDGPLEVNKNNENSLNLPSEASLMEPTNNDNIGQLTQTENQNAVDESKSEDNREKEKSLENVEGEFTTINSLGGDQTALNELTATSDISANNVVSTSPSAPQVTITTSSLDSNVNNDNNDDQFVNTNSPEKKEPAVTNKNATINQTSGSDNQSTTKLDKDVPHENTSVWTIITDFVSSTVSPLFTSQPSESQTS